MMFSPFVPVKTHAIPPAGVANEVSPIDQPDRWSWRIASVVSSLGSDMVNPPPAREARARA
jgi:hypothetical protein